MNKDYQISYILYNSKKNTNKVQGLNPVKFNVFDTAEISPSLYFSKVVSSTVELLNSLVLK